MTLELIAAFAAAFALGGVGLVLRHLSRGRLPRWLVPAMAGAGMIGYAVWSEYSWYARSSAVLPQGVVVVWAEPEEMPLRPWTFFAPLVLRYVAMDLRELAIHPVNADLRLAPLYYFGRWENTRNGMMVVDCTAGRQVLVTEGVAITDDGQLAGGTWTDPPDGDGYQKAACGAG
jgi:hypothetical protein